MRATEQQLRASNQQLEASNQQLRATEEELRAYKENLEELVEEPEPEIKETLEILENEVATSERIISSLLGFARPKPPALQKVDVNDTVQVALSRAAVPENVEVVSQLDEALPTILADPNQLGPGETIRTAVHHQGQRHRPRPRPVQDHVLCAGAQGFFRHHRQGRARGH